jgi:ribonucleoside-diphosphate reductase alpha chain
MIIARVYTREGEDPYQQVRFRAWRGEDWIEHIVPAHWAAPAIEVLLGQVFCRRPLPALTRTISEEGVPEFLWRRAPDTAALDSVSAEFRQRFERDAREVFDRIAGGLAYHGWKAGLFDAEADARAFYDEVRFALLAQKASPEIALLAAAGLDWAYGLEAPLYRPAASILAFSDDLAPRALSGAGVAVAFDEPEPQALRRIGLLAGRLALEPDAQRATVTLPVENADSAAFVNLRRQADIDAAARELGRKVLDAALHRVMDACDRDSVSGFSPAENPALARALDEARQLGVSEAALRMALELAVQGHESVPLAAETEEPAPAPLFSTLSMPDDFIERALTGHGFLLREAGEDKRHCAAEKLWSGVVEALWSSGEPGLLFRDAARGPGFDAAEAGVSASGGLIFSGDVAAPGATLNLAGFFAPGKYVDAQALAGTARLMVLALEAGFAYARLPETALRFRPLALGFTGLSALLMGNALPYDSETGRTLAGLVSALVSGAAFEASAALAAKAPCDGYAVAEKQFLQSLRDKMSAVSGTAHLHRGLTRRPVQLRAGTCTDKELAAAVASAWEAAYAGARQHGLRHAHLTSVGATPALNALLGAPTRDLAPETAVTRFEAYFSGAAELYGKKLNPLAGRALEALGYGAAERDAICFHVVGHGTLLDAPHVNHAALKARGFPRAALDALEAALKTAQHIRYAFNKWTLGEDFCAHMLGFSEEDLASDSFDMLSALGFSEDQIAAANLYCCGAMTLEGAPQLKAQHLPVFDCAVAAARGARRVSAEAQIKMQAAVEAFLSGAAAHVVELPHATRLDEVDRLSLLAWELGVKHLRLYRDNSTLAHALPNAEAALDMLPQENAPASEEAISRAGGKTAASAA